MMSPPHQGAKKSLDRYIRKISRYWHHKGGGPFQVTPQRCHFFGFKVEAIF